MVGSFKLKVSFAKSFAKEPYKRDDILQRRPIILRSLLIAAVTLSMFVRVCECVRERERDRARDKERQRKRVREREREKNREK